MLCFISKTEHISIKEDDDTIVVAVSDGFVILMKRNIIERI